MMGLMNPIDFRMLKALCEDTPKIIQYFQDNPNETENLFVLFHEDVLMRDHEVFFANYGRNLTSLFDVFVDGKLRVSEESYQSYEGAIQLRYVIVRTK